MKGKTYSRRTWLNKKNSPSTGAAVAYHGPSPWGDEQLSYFEVSDCHNSIRLHQIKTESESDFINKMRKLAKMAADFADYLESSNAKS